LAHARQPTHACTPRAGHRSLLTEGRADGRNETHLERFDRNLVELLQEVRVVQTGVQVLFAFLLMAPLTPGFDDLSSLQRVEYFVTLALAGAAALLLIAPTAYHRVLFRLGDRNTWSRRPTGSPSPVSPRSGCRWSARCCS
jgi:hypothetical protein